MPQDILIVDDRRTDLDNFGRAVRFDLNREPFLAENPEDALNILKYYPIKVLVTDHLFPVPSMTGADLVGKVKNELHLRIPCIMITSEKQLVSQEEAGNMGLFRFIDKSRPIKELITAIRHALIEYEHEFLNRDVINLDVTITKKVIWVSIRPKIIPKIIKLTSIDDTFVRENDWHTDHIAERGINQTVEICINRQVSSYYECSTQFEIIEKCGFDLGKAIASLKTNIDSKIGSSVKTTYNETTTINTKLSLEVKDITDSPDEEGYVLHSREYQSAPVFINVNCILQLDCACCQIPRQFDVSINIPTNRIALRQVEHFNKGPKKVVYTGFFP